jgi:hypothetical protein
MNHILTSVGLLSDLIGAILLAFGLFLSPKRVVKLGMDAGGLTSEQTLQQPAVIDLLQQSRLALWGCILLGLGFFFQFGGTF